MKRLVSNKRGEVSYGQKWQNTESSSDSENDYDGSGGDLHSHKVAKAQEDRGDPIPKGRTVEVTVKDGELMYLAALQGDWVAAEVLLERDRSLAFDYVTVEGDRALHVAAAMKHRKFVQELVSRMREEELVLLNGQGYTAFCYAAMSGEIKIARAMLDKNPGLVTVRDEEKTTPLHKAARLGKREMLSFLLGYTKGEDLSRVEWFDLLLVAIRNNMYDVAVDIVGKDGSVAKMANEEEGTALHLLARHQTIKFRSSQSSSMMDRLFELGEIDKQLKFSRLVEKLWGEMQEMEEASLLELVTSPVHIIHDAAKAGQVEIITMLTCTFPHLIWETDRDEYTVFHIAAVCRQGEVFSLIHQVAAMMGFRKMWQDREGNNILHLAAKKAAVAQRKLSPGIQIYKELRWFMAVEKTVPPSCVKMKNRKGLTPRELFSKNNKKLLKEGELEMRNEADSGMLIATILLTVLFTAAFTVPGGYSSQTGEPVLGRSREFDTYVIFEVYGFTSSIISIVMFRSIMASKFAEQDFLFKLPLLQTCGFVSLFMSLWGATVAFITSVSLFNLNMKAVVWFSTFLVCLACILWFWDNFYIVNLIKSSIRSPKYSKHSLFKPLRTSRKQATWRSPL